ncbi:MAG TPA: tRNA 2-thiocytidine(32) synthetase TtcA [Polyangiales bacterium]
MSSRVTQLEKELARELGRCVADFDLIAPGDRIMVCMSGGKDSYTMLHLLERARRRAPIPFSLIAVHLDQGHPGYDGSRLTGWLEAHGFEYRILREDTYSVVKAHVPEGKTYCSLCSRLRRGVLYNAAQELGCSKIALGHHRDDALETLLLNLMFSGSIKSMPPKLLSDDGRNTVIRPLLYCAEPAIAELAGLLEFPILPCDLCGSQDNLKRKQVKQLLTALEQSAPKAKDSMLAALKNVRGSHLLDVQLWQKLGLRELPERGDALGEGLNDELPQRVEEAPLTRKLGRSLRVL